MGLVSVRSSRPGESTDMQYYSFRSSRDLDLTWPEVKLWPWPFNVILYMVRHALTRQTRWYQNRCSTFKIKDAIVKNRFGKFWNFDPWWPQFWLEPKNDRNDLEMIFRELSNPTFSFSLRRPGTEIMGGIQTPPPPPPAGGGKSRGPAGRGLTEIGAILQPVSKTSELFAYGWTRPQCENSECFISGMWDYAGFTKKKNTTGRYTYYTGWGSTIGNAI